MNSEGGSLNSSSQHYTVLARRFRPQAFDDVVGQEHVSLALRNAIRANRVAHAYLFTGARGVGKTSTARILAKALNCPNVKDGVPCNHCEICDGISTGNDVDVLEIDGASNRGIDDIRSLRANVNVRSMRTRFKLYIIDEVHMLTREAFNALLKTLEEPPPNVKFVFCTTEPNKVPDTILSRCQRFDFSAIGEQSIGARLKEIATAEGFTVDDEAIELVARRARGSMRDSQSLFDQLLAFSDGTVHADDVHRMLGTASDDLLVSLFAAITEHRPGEVLNLLDSALNSGVQTGELLDQCVGYVRDQMVTLSGGATVPLCSVGSSRREDVQAQAGTLGLPNVMAAFQILSDVKGRMIRSTFSRVLLEMALVQISMLENLTAISRLLSGQLPSLPAVTAAADAPATGDSKQPTSVETTEKKTAELASEPANPAENSAAASEPAAAQVVFAAGSESDLMTKVLSQCSLTVSTSLKAAKGFAISAPNRLEILLGRTYDFQRRVIEQPDNRSALRNLVRELTGVDPQIGLTLIDEDRPETPRPTPSSAAPSAASGRKKPEVQRESAPQVKGPSSLRIRTDVNPEKDAFVQHVVDAFSAKVVRITDAPARQDHAKPDADSGAADD
ncbi:MAG: DNA polymerase III subunit gamma/tau [Planctomycetaceae bacterium]|nr:DNA polymerase III subunit gamma/tau [Planctomycetaceae bacterium]